MANRKVFGERNKALSEQLLNDKIYFDWVVTTAFYSSIHFVEDAIFPTQVNNTACQNIAEAKRAYKLEGRHATREKLVFAKLDSLVGARYKWLDDNSRNARYKTYKIQSSVASKAKEYLDYIQKHCYKTSALIKNDSTCV